MDKPISIEETDFYKEMELNRAGNLLEPSPEIPPIFP
jgi:hypothetical protein